MAVQLGLVAGFSSHASAQLEEVIVTAQKRAQDIQDVPISITAFTGEMVNMLGWDNPVDLVSLTPNVNGYSVFGNSFPVFWIRGIGTNDQAHGANSPVGVYANEVYHSSMASHGFALFDLDQVEVLRGPQGTLWGKNTTGGAMNFSSRTPVVGEPVQGNMSADFGLYNDDTPQYRFEGGLSFPLTETLAGRIAVKTYNRDGWITNEIKTGRGPEPDEKLDGVDEFAARLTLAWVPSEQFDATLRATLGRRDGSHVPLHFEPVDNPASFVRHGGYVEDPSIDVVSQDRPQPETVDYDSLSLHMNWDTGFGTLTSITGYVDTLYNQDADVDATPRDGLFGPFQANSRQWSQELRLSFDINEDATGIVGAFYFTEDMDGFNWFLTGSDLGPDASAAGCCENSGFGNIEQRERNSWAVFASLDYQVSEKIRINGGVRYTEDEEDWAFQQLFWEFESSRMNDGVPGANGAVTLFDLNDAFDPGQLPVSLPNGKPAGPSQENWGEVTGDIALTYSLTPNLNVYAKYARGYLSGNHVLPFTGANFSLVEPEEINDFEFGLKGTLFDETLQLYSAVFFYDYSNIQVNRGFTTEGQAGFVSLRENAAEATVTGVELEAKWRPVQNWLISVGFGYTDAEFDEFLSDDNAGGVDDFSGFPFPNVPEYNWNLMLSYNMPLQSGAAVEFQTDWNYSDDYFVDSNFRDTDKGEDRTIGNIYLRYHSADEKWSASLYARNVSGEEYIVNRRDFSNSLEGFLTIYGEPRRIGASLDYRF